MKIALHNGDKLSTFPNLALMKLSSYHKSKGDEVEFFSPRKVGSYDKIYSSKVFSFSPSDLYLPNNKTEKGGYGYGLFDELPLNIEHICPDYSLYNIDYSMGFLTRGCFRNCVWCIVPRKEGKLRENAELEEFVVHKKVVFMDNNVLGCEHGLKQIEKIGKLELQVDFNQGLDSRLIDKNVAKLLGKVSWLKPVRLSCDTKDQMLWVAKAVSLLRFYNVSPQTYFCYVLVTDDINDALERVEFLRYIKVDPFAQPFSKDGKLSREQKDFSRWVNHKAIFTSTSWKEYGKDFLAKRKSRILKGFWSDKNKFLQIGDSDD